HRYAVRALPQGLLQKQGFLLVVETSSRPVRAHVVNSVRGDSRLAERAPEGDTQGARIGDVARERARGIAAGPVTEHLGQDSGAPSLRARQRLEHQYRRSLGEDRPLAVPVERLAALGRLDRKSVV